MHSDNSVREYGARVCVSVTTPLGNNNYDEHVCKLAEASVLGPSGREASGHYGRSCAGKKDAVCGRVENRHDKGIANGLSFKDT